jgi:hypothetical protein
LTAAAAAAVVVITTTTTTKSVLRQVHSLYQSELSAESNRVLPVSHSSILSVPEGHPLAPCVVFLVFPALLS